jgi:hypothetical protein
VAYPRGASFADLLDWHLSVGTRPSGNPDRPGSRWGHKEFAYKVGKHERSIRNWRRGREHPTDLGSIEEALFGEQAAYRDWRFDLRAAYDRRQPIAEEREIRSLVPLNAISRPPRYLSNDDDHSLTVWLCHSPEDRNRAAYYADVLTKNGFRVLQRLATRSDALVGECIDKCHFFLILVSENSRDSDRVRHEVQFALQLQQTKRSKNPRKQNYFPKSELDDIKSIKIWCTREKHEIDEDHCFSIEGGIGKINYRVHSKFFILTVLGRAIGGAFFTYDHDSQLMLGNYIVIDKNWRGGDGLGSKDFLIKRFLSEIQLFLAALFPKCLGWVFEVEAFDNAIPPEKKFPKPLTKSDRRKYKRILWYEGATTGAAMGCRFFKLAPNGPPLEIISPCLDATITPEKWEKREEHYWLMWYKLPGAPDSGLSSAALWKLAVKSVYIDITAKSLVEQADTAIAGRYWRYSRDMIERQISEEHPNISIGAYFS